MTELEKALFLLDINHDDTATDAKRMIVDLNDTLLSMRPGDRLTVTFTTEYFILIEKQPTLFTGEPTLAQAIVRQYGTR